MSEKEKKILSVYLDKELIFKLKEIALYSHTNVSRIVEKLVMDFIKSKKEIINKNN